MHRTIVGLISTFVITFLAPCQVWSQHPAMNHPDKFAWQLFAEISKPIDRDNPAGPVIWESWALARDVFADPNQAPSWPNAVQQRSRKTMEALPLQQAILGGAFHASGDSQQGFRFDPAVASRLGNETRMNRESFDFIVKNDLYFVEGQEEFFNRNLKVDFPTAAKEIKAQWRRLDDPEQYHRYHTAVLDSNGEQEVWGLTSLHITTKDVPNWFWATFEHTDNIGREAVVASVDRFGLADDGGPSKELLGLFEQHSLGRKWQNYILRGTQVDFVDSTGRATLLANSQIEQGFQGTSSCITCHARSSIGPKPRLSSGPRPHQANRLSVFESNDPPVGSIGPPDPSLFADTSTVPVVRKYTQLDFVWSMFRAQRRQPFPGVGARSRAGGKEANTGEEERGSEVPCCGAEETDSASSRTSVEALEAAASDRAVLVPEKLSKDEYRELVRKAADFASSKAPERDEEFTRLAFSSIRRSITQANASAGNGDSKRSKNSSLANESHAESPVWDRKELNTNFRKLLMESAEKDSGLFPLLGPPSSVRVVGPGTQVVGRIQFRDCVAVGRRINGRDSYCCTGTLVSPRVVVTAGHCFPCIGRGNPSAVVYVGGDIQSSGETYTGTAYRHPDYNSGGNRNDLAVIVLDSPVQGVTPRRIATTQEIDRSTFVRVVGFGNSDFASTTGFGTKRMVDVPVASISCEGPIDAASLGCDEGLELVAGFVGLGADSCNGDSGGPVYVLVGNDARDDNAWAVAGATSRATAAATRPCGDGAVNARLDQYLDFIHKYTNSNSDSSNPIGKGSRDKE